jgi:hypothetical protein
MQACWHELSVIGRTAAADHGPVARPTTPAAYVVLAGAGKSSLLSVLLRLRPIESGVVRVLGSDAHSLSLRELRSHFAVVPQQPVLFYGTLRENLDPYGRIGDEQLAATLQVWRRKRRRRGGAGRHFADGRDMGASSVQCATVWSEHYTFALVHCTCILQSALGS